LKKLKDVVEENRDGKKSGALLDFFFEKLAAVFSEAEKDKSNIQNQYAILCSESVREFMRYNATSSVYKSYINVCENYEHVIAKKVNTDEFFEALLDLIQSIVELENIILRDP